MVTRFKPYIYRGTGYDIMPEAITSDTSTASLEDVGLEPQRARRTTAANRCPTCDNDYRSRKHRDKCPRAGRHDRYR
jgi:PHP family Zn ribbon phosphoesterase